MTSPRLWSQDMDQVFWYQSLHPSHHNVLSPGVISLVSGLESQDQVPSSLYNHHYHHHYYLYILIITILLIPSFSSSLLWNFLRLIHQIPWRRKWQPTPVFMPGKSRGLRSLVGYSPWGCKESDTTEQLHFTSLIHQEKYLSCVSRHLYLCPWRGNYDWA